MEPRHSFPNRHSEDEYRNRIEFGRFFAFLYSLRHCPNLGNFLQHCAYFSWLVVLSAVLLQPSQKNSFHLITSHAGTLRQPSWTLAFSAR